MPCLMLRRQLIEQMQLHEARIRSQECFGHLQYCPNDVASLFDVSDRADRELMAPFYSRFQEFPEYAQERPPQLIYMHSFLTL